MFGIVKKIKLLNKVSKIAKKLKSYAKNNKDKFEQVEGVIDTVKALAPEFVDDLNEFRTYLKTL
jgi:hypothetical protein